MPPLLKTLTRVFFVLAVVALHLMVPAINAQVVNFPNGFAGSSSQIWLENAATLSGSSIQLTTLGADHAANNAWYMLPVNVQAFTTTFTFTIDCGGSVNNCVSGLGFMIISDPNVTDAGFTFSGFSGNQFSYSQCSGDYSPATGLTDCVSTNAILVKFDTLNIVTGNFGASLTGYYSGGTYPEPPNNPQYDMAPSGIDLTTGDLMRATLAYNGATLTETVTDTVTGATYTTYYTVNIPAAVAGNMGFVGFGAGTGDTATDTTNITTWTYSVETPDQAAAPAFSPAGGTYSGAQSVQVSTTSSGAVICYNTTGSPATNGSSGCASGTQLTGPVIVSASETLYAVAGGTDYKDSPVTSAAYVIQSSVSPPAFSPGAGTYSSAQSVTISDATSNATIYYTTNGTIPATSSTRYTGPITVSSTETLEAIAVAPGDTNSAVATAAYAVSLPSVSSPTFSPAPGPYTSAQSVSISDATSGATIYYTTDGSTPTGSSTTYTGPFTVSSTETLQAIAVSSDGANSAVASAVYTISTSAGSVATPAFAPPAGSYSSAQTVSISDATSGASIYYTTDGSTPASSSTAYTGAITVSSTETVQAIAIASGESAIGSAAYTITLQPNFVLATSAASLTVSAGGQGTVMLTVTPQNGFHSPVVLACSGLPAGTACSFAESTVTPSGGPATTELTISAGGQSSALHPPSQPFLPWTTLALTVGIFGWKKQRGCRHCLLLSAACAGLTLLFGCGGTGGGSGSSTTSPATSTTSTVTITAVSGSLKGTAAIALTVN